MRYQQTHATHFRWIIVVILFAITITNYIDRASMSYAIDRMAQTLHFNDNEMGLILGAFGLGYLITTFLGGIAADHWGARRVLGVALIGWSLAMLLTGFTVGLTMALIARALLGVAEGPNFPTMTRAIGDWLPREERASAFSFSLMAVPIALAIGGPIISQLIIHTSWRVTFFILSGLGLILTPIWWILFRDVPTQSKHVSKSECAKINASDEKENIEINNTREIWVFLLTNPTLLVNYWAFFVFGYYLFFFMGWLPTFLEQHYHMTLKTVGLFSVLPWGLSALFMWMAGKYSDRVLQKTDSYRASRSHFIWISQLLAALCILPVVFFDNIDVSLIFISLAVAFSMSANAMYYAVNVDIIKQRAGTALGIMDACFAIAGFLAPVLTGWLVSTTGQFMSAFLLLAILAFSSVILVLLFHRPDSHRLV